MARAHLPLCGCRAGRGWPRRSPWMEGWPWNCPTAQLAAGICPGIPLCQSPSDRCRLEFVPVRFSHFLEWRCYSAARSSWYERRSTGWPCRQSHLWWPSCYIDSWPQTPRCQAHSATRPGHGMPASAPWTNMLRSLPSALHSWCGPTQRSAGCPAHQCRIPSFPRHFLQHEYRCCPHCARQTNLPAGHRKRVPRARGNLRSQ
mmetsp:Transcript_55575/g.68050  ORF Transcript_55575/g.68050 Transcript_55575/m.68050 type:complete len:202 (+) Transcript_55575:494-1099(+)